MSGSLQLRAAQLLLLLALLALASASPSRAESPSPRYAVRLEQGSSDVQAPGSAALLPVTIALDQLERDIVAAEAGSQSARSVTQLEAEAQQVLARATTTVDRIRARRIIRRLNRIVSDTASVNSNRKYDVQQASYELESSTPMPSSRLVESGEVCEPKLGRLAQAASRLAQYGAPPAEVPVCEPGMMPVPMNTVVACPPPPTRHYLSLDALGWWMKGDRLPALVTTSPIGTPQDAAGVLGEPATGVLFGNQRVNGGIRWGGRATGGVWLDDFQTLAVEGQYWGLASETASFSRTSTFSGGALTDPILARPFFDANPLVNAQSSRIVAFPDFIVGPEVLDLDGTVNVQETSRVQSAMGGIRYAIGPYDSPVRAFLLGAYRFFDLNESLTISTSTAASIPPFPPDAGRLDVYDSFQTRNLFNGGEIGIGTELARNRWTLGAETRLAMGNMNQQLTINGLTSAVYDVYAASYEGGLLAQPTNIGRYTRNRFALIPQVDVRLAFQVLPALRATIGYNFTYVSSVIRPGDQVDLNVNTSQVAGLPLVGPAVPSTSVSDTSIWLQGITMGLDMRF